LKPKNWVILGIILGITLFFLFIYEWIIVIFPNQVFEVSNNQYWIMVEILSDASYYNALTMFNQPSIIFTILNGLVMGVYLNTIGLTSSSKKANMLVVFMIIWIVFSCIGLFGFRITLNFEIFLYKSYTSNTAEGILFFVSNLPYLALIFMLSHLIEGERK